MCNHYLNISFVSRRRRREWRSCACFMLFAGLITLLPACSGRATSDAATDSSDILMIVGDSSLTLRDVQRRIPAGITGEDSVALFNSIVESWLDNMLLAELAEKNIVDMDRIDRLTADYRKKLIIAEYRRNLRESHDEKVSQADIDKYYAAHKDEMVLDGPVVKGLYIKVPADSERLNDIRRWMVTATPDAVDNLERYGLREASEYSFFDNTWTQWSNIAGQVPYRFGDADEFVKKNQNFETTYRGMTYLIHISESLPKGEAMPREVADPIIRERLETLYGDRYEQRLIRDLYQQAEKEGRLMRVRN